MPEKKITVLITDDHAIVRQGLRTLLELMDDIEVAGEAPNGKIAVEMAAKLHPDVILMDLMMPEMDGITAIQKICEQDQSIKDHRINKFFGGWQYHSCYPGRSDKLPFKGCVAYGTCGNDPRRFQG